MNFSAKEKLGFRIRISLRKKHDYSLEDSSGSLIMNPDLLGNRMPVIIPCLDPNLSENKRKDSNLMATKYKIGHNDYFDDLDITPDYMATHYPVFYDFYPSDEVLKKLIMRMT